MKIDSAEVSFQDLGLSEPYEVAYSQFDKAENVFIRLGAGNLNGWGCAAPDPGVTGETAEGGYEEALKQIPFFIGRDPFRRARLVDDLKKRTPGLYSLWAAVDMALWDLLGKKAALPVWKLLGGYREKIKTSVTIGICSRKESLKRARLFLEEGFFILKIKGGKDVEDDIARLADLRRKTGSSVRLRFDANQGYSREEALHFLEETRDFNVELLEQPTPRGRPELLGVVGQKTQTPIMADESLVSLLDAFHLVKRGLVDLMNVKIMKVGGLSEAIQVDAVARSAGVEVMVGCMDESALGIAAGLHFALSRKNIRYADLDGHFGHKTDPAASCVKVHKGCLYPSRGAGFGWEGF